MATRNYFILKNTDDKVEPYIGSSDILVEAYHDGYLAQMLQEIKDIPKKMLEYFILTKNWRLRTFARGFNPNGPYLNKKWFINGIASIGFMDLTWDSLVELLQITQYGKYNRIEPGVDRYGRPVTFDDAEFQVECEFNRINSVVKITLLGETSKELLEDFGFDEDKVLQLDLVTEFNDLLFEYYKNNNIKDEATL